MRPLHRVILAAALGLQALWAWRVLPTEGQPVGQGSVTVVETSTQLNFALPNGQHTVWDKPTCNLLRWTDAAGSTLGVGTSLSVNGASVGLASRHYSTYSLSGDTATVRCTIDTGGGSGIPWTITATSAERQWGVPYQGLAWQQTLDGSAVTGAPNVDSLEVGFAGLQVAGNPLGLHQWSMDPAGAALQQFNFAYPELHWSGDDAKQTFTLLTHANGAFVAYVPDLTETWVDFTGFTAGQNYPAGTSLLKTFHHTGAPSHALSTPHYAVLFAVTPRAVPQSWLDARLGVFREQWRSLGLGPQHFHIPQDGFQGGDSYWADSRSPDYLNVNNPNGFAPIPGNMLELGSQALHTPMFDSDTPGGPPTHTSWINEPEMYVPNAYDLPAVIPGVTFAGQPPLQDPKTVGVFTSGSMQDLRDMLDHQRIVGGTPGIWHRDYYPGCSGQTASNTTQYSRWDLHWYCSYLWKAHPEWGAERPDGSLDPSPQAFPNSVNPAYHAWRLAWHRYWLDLGLMSFFMDTTSFPADGRDWSQGQVQSVGKTDLELLVDVVRNGGAYVMGEQPTVFGVGSAGRNGNPMWHKFTEWAYTFTTHSWGTFPAGDQVIYPNPGMAWDVRTAQRFHETLAPQECCGTELQPYSSPNMMPEVAAENAHYTALVERYGLPDRVELINPRLVAYADLNSTEKPTLRCSLSATETNKLDVYPMFTLPWGGVVQIGNERILFKIPQMAQGRGTDTSGNCPASDWTAVGDLIRGYGGTPISAHSRGDPVIPVDDQQHWDWDGAYWVYGDKWLRYSDGSLWQAGGTVQANAPVITGVQVSGSSVTWTTDVPTAGWIEYDTYGNSEQYGVKRNPVLWPAYRWKSNRLEGEPTPSTSHTATLDKLVPDALTHYSVVAWGGARTADATFTAGQVGPTPTPAPPTSTPTSVPVATATPTPGAPVTYDDPASAWTYAGTGWGSCSSCAPPASPPIYAGTAHWTSVIGDTATLAFSGTQATLRVLKDVNTGIVGVSVDGGAETLVDTYSAARQGDVAVWTSPVLTAGVHTLRVRETGTKNAASANHSVVVDRAEVASNPTPTATATPVPPTATATATATPTPTNTPTATPTPPCRVFTDRGGGTPTPVVQPSTALCGS